MEMSAGPSDPHIRRLDVRRDLKAAADLIEQAFSPWLDSEGWAYLQQVREAARSTFRHPFALGYGEHITTPLFGYVWEENGRVLGNLSLIPYFRQGRCIYMIANVAVEPQSRRRGIATALTRAALAHIKGLGLPDAWLQVREDNYTARSLYRSCGFLERSVRTTWERHSSPPVQPVPGLQVRPRRKSDWPEVKAWLETAYPREVIWNLPFTLSRLSPSLLNRLTAWMNASPSLHLSACSAADGSLLAALAVDGEPGLNPYAWIGMRPGLEDENAALLALLAHVPPTLRHLRCNYPAGRGEEAFLASGFTRLHNLVWMECRL